MILTGTYFNYLFESLYTAAVIFKDLLYLLTVFLYTWCRLLRTLLSSLTGYIGLRIVQSCWQFPTQSRYFLRRNFLGYKYLKAHRDFLIGYLGSVTYPPTLVVPLSLWTSARPLTIHFACTTRVCTKTLKGMYYYQWFVLKFPLLDYSKTKWLLFYCYRW